MEMEGKNDPHIGTGPHYDLTRGTDLAGEC